MFEFTSNECQLLKTPNQLVSYSLKISALVAGNWVFIQINHKWRIIVIATYICSLIR